MSRFSLTGAFSFAPANALKVSKMPDEVRCNRVSRFLLHLTWKKPAQEADPQGVSGSTLASSYRRETAVQRASVPWGPCSEPVCHSILDPVPAAPG